MPTPPSLTIVVPMWNEAEGAAHAVEVLLDTGRLHVAEHDLSSVELVAVDDGSTDATPAILDHLAREHAELRVVHHERNQGLGAAVRTGIAASSGDLVLYTDADLPAEPAALGEALRLRAETGATLVAAYRNDRADDGPRRYLYSLVWNALCRLALGIRVRDVNFAFKLVDGPSARSLTLTTDGAFVDAELVARITAAGGAVVQFGTDYCARQAGHSSLSSPAVIADMLRELRRLRPELRAARAATRTTTP